ncbi:MAG: HAD family phosphatase [Ruminococcus sp.]|nr:HAD family phosphatase [Ruminococcus sp.]
MPDLSKYFLITDLDGTLLPNNKILSEIDKNAIQKFVHDGGKFTIATGRTLQSAQRYIDELEIKMPVIMYNGSLIYDNSEQKVLYTDELPVIAENIAKDLLNFMENPGAEILRLDNIYIICNNGYEKEHTQICQVTPLYMPIEDVPSGGWFKILFATSPDEITRIEEYVKGKDYPVDFVRSHDIFIEMLPKNGSKGTALKEYLKMMNMKDIRVVAAGDYHNDIEMLETADCGAATANAQPLVKEKADIVLTKSCNEGAIAELIDKIYLGEI